MIVLFNHNEGITLNHVITRSEITQWRIILVKFQKTWCKWMKMVICFSVGASLIDFHTLTIGYFKNHKMHSPIVTLLESINY